ncbi:adenosine deaminase [Aurantimonas aggregata]|uniref:Adenine deaminase n=1 Tax=Aurantimonas aggregata TaxID=2047720 RepID=A0A6L9MET5_9HYPH|nr:adenosine deaminase [Aurantimonas aggregata]NDV86257.1 adenosine deaminase [Aurantimonas aggregata]
MPMAELHCHIEGAAHPDLVRAHAARHGIDVSGIIRDGHYVWHDFTSFLAAYDRASSVFRSEADYADLAADHLGRLAAAGAIYAEFFVSPDHACEAGLAPEAYVASLSRGIEQARQESGIEARMIVVGVRHLGPEAVERAARFAARPSHPLVTGFGLAGDERIGTPADFARAFAIARDAGLGLTAHAGELCGPESVRAALDALKPSRIGHGVRAIEDPELVRRIVGEGIVLEVCPGSNLALGIYPDAASHPLKRLVSAGVRVTLNSDDPPFFRTTLADEYAFAAEAGIDAGTRLGFTRQAIEAAFVDDATRHRLLDRLGRAAIALGAPSAGG